MSSFADKKDRELSTEKLIEELTEELAMEPAEGLTEEPAKILESIHMVTFAMISYLQDGIGWIRHLASD